MDFYWELKKAAEQGQEAFKRLRDESWKDGRLVHLLRHLAENQRSDANARRVTAMLFEHLTAEQQAFFHRCEQAA